MKMRIQRKNFFLFFVTYFAINLYAFAQTNSTSTNSLALQSANVVEIILLNARPILSKAFLDLTTLNNNRNEILNAEKIINEKIIKSKENLSKLEKIIKDALIDIFRAETRKFVVSDIANLHYSLSDFTPRYKVQVNIPGANYSDPYVQPILGGISMRPAMGEIIDAQADDLEHIAKIIQTGTNTLQIIEQEMRQISITGNFPYPSLGVDHYLETVYIRIDSLKRILNSASLFLGGLNINSEDNEPLICDQNDSKLQSLSSQLLDIWDSSNKTNKYLGVYGFSEELRQIDLAWYDGNSYHNQIGLIQHWQNCLRNKQNIAEDLRKKLEQARLEGRNDLARETNAYRLSYVVEITELEAELSSLFHRRNIIANRLMRAAEIQALSVPYEKNTAPWHRAVQAISLNLYQLHALHPPILKSAYSLLNDASTVIDTNTLPSSIDEQKLWFSDTANKIRIDNELGLYRLVVEVQSAASSLRVMAANIRNSQSGLEQAIYAYEDISYLKITDLNKEIDVDLPYELNLANQKYSDAKQSQETTVKSLEIENFNLTEYAKLKEYYLSRLTFLDKNIIKNKFLEIYEGLVDKLLEPSVNLKDYIKNQDAIEFAIQNKIYNFIPIDSNLTTGPQIGFQTKKVCKKRKKKKICKIVVVEPKNKLLASLVRQARIMNQNMSSNIDEVSLSLLNNQSLSGDIANLQAAYKKIQEMTK